MVYVLMGVSLLLLARMTRNGSAVSSKSIKSSCCFLEQGSLTLLFRTGWLLTNIGVIMADLCM